MISIWIVLWFGIAHWLSDFVLQTDWMAVNKSKRWDALIAHVHVYSAGMMLAMLPVAGLTGAVKFAFITYVAHFLTDAATSRMGRALFPWSPSPSSERVYIDYEGDPAESQWGLGLSRSRHWFFTVIGADQWLLHWPQLILTAYWVL